MRVASLLGSRCPSDPVSQEGTEGECLPSKVGKLLRREVQAFVALAHAQQMELLAVAGIFVFAKTSRCLPVSQEDAEADAGEGGAASGADEEQVAEVSSLAEASESEAAPAAKTARRASFISGESGAVVPVVTKSCQLAVELQTEVHSVDFGQARQKPRTLRAWGQDFGSTLELVAVRESGVCYYAAKPLLTSPTANHILSSAAGLPEKFMRLLLLLTPAQRVSLPTTAVVEVVADPLAPAGGIATDGQLEIGADLALALQWVSTDGPATYVPRQIRGNLCLAPDRRGLVKGMVCVNDLLPPWTLRVHKSCVKLEWSGVGPDEIFVCGKGAGQLEGAKAGGPPRLNHQLLAALQLRFLAMADNAQRAESQKSLESLVAECKAATVAGIRDKAWGLDQPFSCSIPRVPHSSMKFVYSAAAGSEESLGDLEATLSEAAPWDIRCGTRESLLRGGQRATSMLDSYAQRGHLDLPAGCSGSGVALSDCHMWLEPGQVCIRSDGGVVEGPVVLWRYPALQPTDLVVAAAVRPPPGERWVPRNSVLFSRKDEGVSRLAGGDYDGDDVFWCGAPALSSAVRLTEPCVAALPLQGLRAELRERVLLQRATLEIPDGIHSDEPVEEYLRFAASMPTPPVRGLLTAMCERAQHAALAEQDQAKVSASLAGALRSGVVAELAMDAPKKFDAAAVPRPCCDRRLVDGQRSEAG